MAGSRGLQLNSIDDMWRFAQCLLASGMAPRGMETLEAIVIALECGAEIGLPPMQSIQTIAVINRRPSVYADGMVGLVLGSGLLDNAVFKEWNTGDFPNDDYTAHCRVRRLPDGEPHEQPFSIADAKKANLWGKQGPWTEYPKRMLVWRARGWAFRTIFADVLKGLQVAEEAMDIPRNGPAVAFGEQAALPTADALAAQAAAAVEATGTPAALPQAPREPAPTVQPPAPPTEPAQDVSQAGPGRQDYSGPAEPPAATPEPTEPAAEAAATPEPKPDAKPAPDDKAKTNAADFAKLRNLYMKLPDTKAKEAFRAKHGMSLITDANKKLRSDVLAMIKELEQGDATDGKPAGTE